MARVITLTDLTASYQIELDGEDLSLDLYYLKNIDRWAMDLRNNRLNVGVVGQIVNTGVDLLTTAGHLGLQALVPVSIPSAPVESTLDNFNNTVVLMYLTLEEYNEFRYAGIGDVRLQWSQDRELSFEDIRAIVGNFVKTEIDPNTFVKKPDSFVIGNLIEFNAAGNAEDSGSTVQDILDQITTVDVAALAVSMAIALGD